MLSTFTSVKQFLKYNPLKVTTDNLVFRFHYRWTFVILIVATILVTSRQYIGEHIKCISDTIPEHVVNTYCFFTPTFTMVRHLNNSAIEAGAIFEPGIGPFENQNEPIKRHAYYQWVPFVLFGQALCFYLPHMLWKACEGGRIKALAAGLKMFGIVQYLKKNSHKLGKLKLPSTEETEMRIKDIRRTMIDRMRLNQSWGAHLVMCEFFNLFNLCLQIGVTNKFLGGAFFALGPQVLRERWTDKMDALDIVFPKVTKCHFRKFGPSGSLQMHDTLCVMALNIINEKIFAILWFWYLFLLVVTVLEMIWRVMTMMMYKYKIFYRFVFYWAKPGRMDHQELADVIQKCNFGNYMFLVFLKSNLSEFLFKKVIFHLASDVPNPQFENDFNSLRDFAEGDPLTTASAPFDEVDHPKKEKM